MSVTLPLSGIRVLDFTWVGAGPLATRFLADFGAEVIKVESRQRPDPLRITPPLARGTDPLERSGYFANRNANKKSFALNMEHAESREVVMDLARVSDVCAQSFRPGTMEKWGLGYADLTSARRDLIYLSMPLQGNSGPHATFSGFGATLVALSGLHDLCGDPDRLPVGTGTNYPDHVPNPMHAAIAVLAALFHRRRTGQGQEIELSQLESTLNVLGPALEKALVGDPPARAGNRVVHACPHGVFPVLGVDRWIAISVMNDDEWRGLLDAVGGALLPFSDLVSLASRKAHEAEIEDRLSQWTKERDGETTSELLQSHGVPAAVLQTAADLLAEGSSLRERGAFVWKDHPVMGRSVYSATTPRLSRTPGAVRTAAPLLGADTEEICLELLGYSRERIDGLREAGVLN